eukprot:GGOE01005459.1.p1 GENE.GGOE01005459.1~~GGOE01005459.1.p1  ORF type:complete len:685 (-),score=186.99 GGOE01005459.1:350-2350(-)
MATSFPAPHLSATHLSLSTAHDLPGGSTSPVSAPVPSHEVRSILKLDLDAVCERLNVSTRELVKKLGQKDRFNLEDMAESDPGPSHHRSSALGFGTAPESYLGVSPQFLGSLVGSQTRVGSGSFRSPTNDSMTTTSPVNLGGLPMGRSPSGFGFMVARKPSSPLRQLGVVVGSERAPLLTPSGHSPRPTSPGMMGFLSQEWHLPSTRRHSFGLGSRPPLYGEHDTECPVQPSPSLSFARMGSSFTVSRSHLSDPALLHKSAYIIPGAGDGVSFMAVPELPEPVPLKKRLRLPKIPPEIHSVEVVQHMEPETQLPKVYVIVNFARPLFGWLVLVMGVTMMATVGPISDEILRLEVDSHSVSGFLLGSWNAQGLTLGFFLCAVVSWLIGDWMESTYRYFFSLKGLSLMMISGIISGAGSGCWTLSFTQTSVEQSYLFNSFHPTLIILCRLLSLQPVFIGEAVGLALGLAGASVSAITPDDKFTNKLFGDALAFMSSISLCFYLLFSKRVRPHVPLPAMLTVVCFFSAVTQTLMALVMDSTLTLDQHPTHGVFGYRHPTYFLWWVFMLVVTGIGQAGYIGALKYLNPVVVSICMTSEPAMAMFIGNFLAYFLRQEIEWPTRLSLAGGLLIVLGSMVVSYFSKNHADGLEVDVSEEAETVAVADPGGGSF